MARYIGVDLHTNSFTICILAGGEEKLSTYPLQKGGLDQFIKILKKDDEIAVEATGNSSFFCSRLSPYVKKVTVIAPYQFAVIRRSTKKTDRNDARAIALFLSKDMLPEAKQKDTQKGEISSLIAMRERLVKTRQCLILKVHSLFVRHGLKAKRDALNSKRSLIARLSSPHFKKYLPNTLLFEDIYNYLPQIFFFLLALFKSLKLLQRKKLYLELYQNPIFNIKLYFVFM